MVCEDAELWNDSWAFVTGYFAIGGRLLTIGGIFYNQFSTISTQVLTVLSIRDILFIKAHLVAGTPDIKFCNRYAYGEKL